MRVFSFRLLATVLAVFAMPVAASAAEGDAADTITYRVLKGDNLYTLAERYLTRVESYGAIQHLNRVPDPRKLRVGTRLVIPRRLLRETSVRAVVHTFRGSVRIGKPGEMLAPTVGMTVTEGDLIETGGKSFVSLRMPDGTAVALPSQTRVRVERLRQTLLAGSLSRVFAIEKGRASAIVRPDGNANSEFKLSTPVAVSAVRGTVLRISYDPSSRRATSEVIEGKVEFSVAGSGGHFVSAGFGAASDLGKAVPLLAAPDIIDAGRVQSDEQLRFTIRLLINATRYRAQISRDAGFLEVLDETETTSDQVQFASIPNGEFFVRVTGIDQNALEGRPATYSFSRRLNRITTTAETRKEGRYRQYLFRWHAPDARKAQYRFQLSADSDGASPLVDEPGLTRPSFVITDLPPGVYFWRVQTTEVEDHHVHEQWARAQELRVEAD